MKKLFNDAEEERADITDGAILLLGGFGVCGIPTQLHEDIGTKAGKNLTCISNNAGIDDFGIGLMLRQNG